MNRPALHLLAAGKMYPNAWKQVDTYRQSKGKALPDWPAWCFLPMAATYTIVSEGGMMLPNRLPDVARLSAMIAWRYTQGIYRFEPHVYQNISDTIVKRDIPVEVLYRLPEWGVYIETPSDEINAYGFFAHLEYDVNTGRSELRLLIDSEEALYPIILHMGEWTVTEAIDRAMGEAAKQAKTTKTPWMSNLVEPQSNIAHHCVSLLLYLCSEEPDIERVENELPKRPKPTKVKGGWKLFPPKKPKIWRIGEAIGAKIQQYTKEPTGAEHASPTPHIRRAHWHGYWTGSAGTDNRKFIYKWLPPIVVNASDK